MKVLITGVAGFIGSHLADRLLAEGHKVYGIDNFDDFYSREDKLNNLSGAFDHPNFHFYEFDITDKSSFDTLPQESFSIVFHLAAKAGVRPSIEAPEKYVGTNINGTLNVLEYMRSAGIRKMVFASSSSIYGNCRTIPFSEDLPVDKPISPYAMTKKACELLNYNYHHLYQIDIVNLRFFTVFGPRQRPDLAIHKFLNKIRKGQAIEVYGDGSAARDFTYIDDIVSGVVKAGEFLMGGSGIFETINLGNNTPVKLKDLVMTFKRLLDEDFAIAHKGMQEGDVDITYASVEKAKRVLGFQPHTSFEDGMRKFIEWHGSKKKIAERACAVS